MSALRKLADLIDSLPDGLLQSLVLATLPLVGLYLYRRFIHIPQNERAVAFEWNVPVQSASVEDILTLNVVINF